MDEEVKQLSEELFKEYTKSEPLGGLGMYIYSLAGRAESKLCNLGNEVDRLQRELDLLKTQSGVWKQSYLDQVKDNVKMQANSIINNENTNMPDKPKNNTEKRLSDLEVKYKWIEEIVAKMYMKDNQVQKPLTPKNQRLWRPMVHTRDYNSAAEFRVNGRLIDVMLADGEVVTKMERARVPVKNYPDDPKNVVAWRESEQ
jgi:hypothetical protein